MVAILMMITDKIWCGVFLLILLAVPVCATSYSVSNFNDSSTARNVTYTGSGNMIVYVDIPVNANITSGILSYKGYSSGGVYPSDVTVKIGSTATNDDSMSGVLGISSVFENHDFTDSENNTAWFSANAYGISESPISALSWNGTYMSPFASYGYIASDDGLFTGASVYTGNHVRYLVSEQNYMMTPTYDTANVSEMCFSVEMNFGQTVDVDKDVMKIEANDTTSAYSIGWNQSISTHANCTTDADTLIVGGKIYFRMWVNGTTDGNLSGAYYKLEVDADYVKVNLTYGGDASLRNISLNTTAISDYLSSCTPGSDGNCTVPINISSDTAGVVELSQLEINYTDVYVWANTTPDVRQTTLPKDRTDSFTVTIRNKGYWTHSYELACASGDLCDTTLFTVTGLGSTINLDYNEGQGLSVQVDPIDDLVTTGSQYNGTFSVNGSGTINTVSFEYTISDPAGGGGTTNGGGGTSFSEVIAQLQPCQLGYHLEQNETGDYVCVQSEIPIVEFEKYMNEPRPEILGATIFQALLGSVIVLSLLKQRSINIKGKKEGWWMIAVVSGVMLVATTVI